MSEWQLRRSRGQMGRQHVRIVRVEHRRLDRGAEDHLRMGEEVGVERVVGRNEDRQRLLPRPTCPPGLLPQAGPATRPSGDQHRVESTDVDAELESIRRGRSQEVALAQVPLQAAPVLGQISPAIGSHSIGNLGSPVPQAISRPRGQCLHPRTAAREGHGLGVASNEISEEIGSLGRRRDAVSVDRRRLPQGEAQRPAG